VGRVDGLAISLEPLSVKSLLKLFANNGQLSRGFDSQSHTALGKTDHRYDDLIANENALTNFSGKYQHGDTAFAIQPHSAYLLRREMMILLEFTAYHTRSVVGAIYRFDVRPALRGKTKKLIPEPRKP